MLRKLVTPQFATQLLEVGLAHREATDGRTELMTRDVALEPYRSFMFSERMEANATRLCDRKRFKGIDVPLRYRYDNLVLKPPGGKGTTYHQDSSEHGSDRVGELQFWLALATVTPEMGAMRFVDRSHREGPLGSTFNGDDDGGFNGSGDLLQQYPLLVDELGLSEPFFYEPGDCTLHHGFCVHGGPDNTTPDPRWSFLFSYTPADTRYWPDGSGVGSVTATNPGTRRVRAGDEANPFLRPRM